jgi:hypothetical protein
MFEFSFNVSPCQVEPQRRKCRETSSKITDAGTPNTYFLPLRITRGRLIVTQNGLPRHATMRHNQGVKALPPGKISPFTAEKPDHLQHVVDFRRAERRIEGRHHASTFGDDLADLRIAFFFDRIAKIRRLHRQRRRQRTIAITSRSMTIKTALSVERVHAFVPPATGA